MVRQREVREREREAGRQTEGHGRRGRRGGEGTEGRVLSTLAPILSDQRPNQGQEQKLDMTKGAAGYYPSLQVQ